MGRAGLGHRGITDGAAVWMLAVGQTLGYACFFYVFAALVLSWQQNTDWGAPVLSDAQQDYAASDVRYLHAMHAILVERLAREGRSAMAQACFEFLPTRALLDIAGWAERDIFSHE